MDAKEVTVRLEGYGKVHVHAHFNFIILGISLGFYLIFPYIGINTCRNDFFIGIGVTHHKTSPPLRTATMIKTH
jgi:hypothetical protein